MSTTVAQSTHAPSAVRPSFSGIVSGELYKIRRMRFIWISFYGLLAILCLPNIIFFTLANIQSMVGDPKNALLAATAELAIIRIFIGFFLLILTANVYGREYQQGTIRILLARGVGRLQLLFAKLVAVVLVTIVVFLLCLLLDAVFLTLLLGIKVGSFTVVSQLDWNSVGLYLLTVLVSMGETILVSLALTSIGRSLAFGLSASLAWFPADNILSNLLMLGYLLTKSAFWLNITQYFLGPNLNYMPTALLSGGLAVGTTPYAVQSIQGHDFPGAATLDSTHVWLVMAAYAVVFLAISLFLTAKRDVRE